MDCQLTEINRFRCFRLFSVTEINRSPYRGGKVFGGGFRFDAYRVNCRFLNHINHFWIYDDDRRSCLECVKLAGFGTAGTGGTKVTVLCQQASDVQITPVGVDPLSVSLVPAQVSAQTTRQPYQ